MTSSDAPATPGTDKKKQPVTGAAIENRAADTAKDAATEAPAAKPQIESTLVGKPVSGHPAAAKRSDTAAQATPVPAVSKPETKAEPRPEPVTRTVETRVEVRKGGFMPTFLGGLVAAGLGAAATYWAIPHLPPPLRPGAVEAVSPEEQLDAARSAGTEAARAEISAQAEALSSRAADAGADAARQALADSAPAAAAPAGVPAEVTDKITALEQGVADLTNRMAQQPGAPADAATQTPAPVAAAPAGPSQAEFDALAARLNEQQSRIDELAARPAVDPATAQQVQTLASQAEELQKTTEDANRRAQAASAAAALQSAIEGGAPRDQALADLTGAGIEVPAVLTGDVPRLDQLRAEFPAAAREGLRASIEAQPANGGVMSAVGDFLRVQTGARSVEPRDGTDPDAVLSRANAAVEAGNIQGAMTEIAALPQAGQQAMAQWTGRAQVWVDANAALNALVSGSR
ncbi:COG4223 family protein [Paracoccus laeviglucosivorans]|uniref:Inner membrane protein n=1 Tax=Paracoccus laeviglucosivorans TaxID=1197861 RepID=A0A521E6G6_9RHOB|nr:hypothetical protein [Paracoccus laeviglucosivorans]SMO79534.1 hypothetical protein SAMN06265221_111102 [Paracoccus laeviglucosivorans]